MGNWNIKGQEQQLQKINNSLNPGAKQANGNAKPYYATGGRCMIKIGGKSVAVCQDFRWQLSYTALPIHTIDTPFAWDIDIGQVNIQATLSKIFDPLKGPETDTLFAIMAAAVHQPMVELQVIYQAEQTSEKLEQAPSSRTFVTNVPNRLQHSKTQTQTDKVDFSMFFARGMFTSTSGNATLGQLSQLTAQFTGVAYQHYVAQGFTPYGPISLMADALEMGQNIISKLTGGFG